MAEQPIRAVVRVATSPEQAQVFAALLQGAGIPAFVEGSGLADEFAVSRRMLNQQSVRVYVPTASLEQAREVLGEVHVDDDELERQALEAADPEQEPGTPPA